MADTKREQGTETAKATPRVALPMESIREWSDRDAKRANKQFNKKARRKHRWFRA